MDLTFNESMYGLDEMDTATESFDNYDFAMESEDGGDIKKTSLFQRIMNWFANMWEKLKAKVAKIKEAAAKSKVGQALAKFKTAWNQAKAAKSAEELQKCYEQGQSYAGDIAVAARDAYKQGKKEGSQQGFKHGKEKGHQEGHKEGFMEGHKRGEARGYNKGMNRGHAVGYNKGMDEGIKKGTADGAKFGYDMGYSQGSQDSRVKYDPEFRREANKAKYESAKKSAGISEKIKAKTNEQIVADKAADKKQKEEEMHKLAFEAQKKKYEQKIREAELRLDSAKTAQEKKAAMNAVAQWRRVLNGLASSISQDSFMNSLEAEEIAIEAAFADYFGINHVGVSAEVDTALNAMESTTEISCLDVDTCAETIIGLEAQIEQFNRDVNALKIASENYLVDGDLETRVAASKLPAKRLHQACVDLGIASESFCEKDIQNLHDFLMGANDIMIDRANDLIRYGALEEFGYTADDEDAEIATESDLYDMDDLDAMESALDFELEMSDLDGTEDYESEVATESFEGESVNFLNSLVNESYLDYEDEGIAEEGLNEVAGKVARAGKSVVNAILNAITKLIEKFRNLRVKILSSKVAKNNQIPEVVYKDYTELIKAIKKAPNLEGIEDSSLYKGFMGEYDYHGRASGHFSPSGINAVKQEIASAIKILSESEVKLRKALNQESVNEAFVNSCRRRILQYKAMYRVDIRYMQLAIQKWAPNPEG